jgi:DNA-binding transcriptional ArsR family regulator
MSTATETTEAPETTAPKPVRKPKFPDGKRIYGTSVLLKTAADPSRLHILLILAEKGEEFVGALSVRLEQTQPATSHHVTILRHAGIVERRRRGQNNFYALSERGQKLVAALRGLMVP